MDNLRHLAWQRPNLARYLLRMTNRGHIGAHYCDTSLYLLHGHECDVAGDPMVVGQVTVHDYAEVPAVGPARRSPTDSRMGWTGRSPTPPPPTPTNFVSLWMGPNSGIIANPDTRNYQTKWPLVSRSGVPGLDLRIPPRTGTIGNADVYVRAQETHYGLSIHARRRDVPRRGQGLP